MNAPDRLLAFRPSIKVGGQAAAWAEGALLQMAVIESEAGLATLELGLLNWQAERGSSAAGYAFEDEADLALGTEIEVSVGQDPSNTLFKGRVHALEGVFPDGSPPHLIVLAEDRAAALRLQRRSARYEQMSAAGVVRQIAQRHGLSADIDAEFGSTADWLQLGETDLACVRRLCATHGRRVRLDNLTLKVSNGLQPDGGSSALTLDLHANLKEARVLADLAHQRTAVRVTGFDIAAGQSIDETASSATPLPGSSGGGRTGPQLLRSAIGEQTEALHHQPGWTATEARALAQQALDERARRFVRLRATALSQPGLRCGRELRTTGMGPRFSQTYVVSRVEHRFDTQLGFRTEFEAWGACLGQAA